MTRPVIELSQLEFCWKKAAAPVLSIESLQINQGERVFINGSSGCGKSSLLNVLSGIALPQRGQLSVLDHDLTRLNASERDHFRAHHIGYIFQMFNLIPYLSVLENILLSCLFSDKRKQKILKQNNSLEDEALRLLEHLEMASNDILHKPVTELSVGQQQRVAAARALMGSPELIIADEPTSSLDEARRTAFIDLLFRECESSNSTLIFVSHDSSLQKPFERIIEFEQLNLAYPGSEKIMD